MCVSISENVRSGSLLNGKSNISELRRYVSWHQQENYTKYTYFSKINTSLISTRGSGSHSKVPFSRVSTWATAEVGLKTKLQQVTTQ